LSNRHEVEKHGLQHPEGDKSDDHDQRVIITARLVVVLSSEQSQQGKSKLKIYNLNVIIVVASH